MRELGQFSLRRRIRAFTGERADVQLVYHLPLERHAGPRPVRPLEGARIDNFGRAMRPFGLKPRRRIRVGLFVAAETIPVPRAGLGLGDAAEVPALLRPELRDAAAVDDDRHLRYGRRPDAKMRPPAADRFGADRQPAREVSRPRLGGGRRLRYR